MTERELILKIKTLADTAGFADIESKASGLKQALVGAGIGAAAGTIAQQVVGIGTAFDDVYDGMAITTGKTGEELAGLQQSFRNVVANVPVDFETASSAVTTLSQRTGLTGKSLDDMAIQVANLSRITGTDATAAANSAADTFARWNVAAGDQSKTLDTLFAASQQSGVGFDTLTQQVNQFAPQLQAMGMDLTESAAMLGTMGKAGIDASSVMPGLTKALREAAAAGKDPATALQDLFAKVKAEGPTSATAMDAFGKSGLAVAAAVAQGKLDYQAFAATLSANQGTINDTATGTDDLQQKFDLMKNKVMLAAEGLAPLGMTLQPIVGMLPMLGGALGMAVPLLGGLASSAMAAVPAVIALAAPFLPIIIAIGAVIAIVAALKYAWDHNLGGIQEKVAAVVAWIQQAWGAFVGFLSEKKDLIITILLAIITGGLSLVVQGFLSHKDQIMQTLSDLGAGIQQKWDEFTATISAAIEAIKTYITVGWELFKAYIYTKLFEIGQTIIQKWEEFKTTISDKLKEIYEQIKLKWDAFLREIQDKLAAILGAITTKWDEMKAAVTGALEAIKTAITEKWEAMRAAVSEALDRIKEVITAAWDKAKEIITGALDKIKDTIKTSIEGWKKIITEALKIADWLWDTITGAVDKVKEALADLASKAIAVGIALWQSEVAGALKLGEWIGNVIDKLKESGSEVISKIKAVGGAIVNGMKTGISEAFSDFVGWFKSLFPNIIDIAKQILGIGSPSRVMADEIGRPIAEGIVQGMREGLADAPFAEVIGEWYKLGSLWFFRAFTEDIKTRLLERFVLPGTGGSMGRGSRSGGGISPGFDPRTGGLFFDPMKLSLLNAAMTKLAITMEGVVGGLKALIYGTPGAGVGVPTGGKSGVLYNPPRRTGTVDASAFRTGRGGFIAASSTNYWRQFVQKYGVPTEESARKTAAALGIPLPPWLEEMYKPVMAAEGNLSSGPSVLRPGGPAAGTAGSLTEVKGPVAISSSGNVVVTPGAGGISILNPTAIGADEVTVESVTLGDIVMGAQHIYLDGREIARAVARAFIDDVTVLDQLGRALGQRQAQTTS